jgi:hypothetical protein
MSMPAQPAEDVTFVDYWRENTEIIQVAGPNQFCFTSMRGIAQQRSAYSTSFGE